MGTTVLGLTCSVISRKAFTSRSTGSSVDARGVSGSERNRVTGDTSDEGEIDGIVINTAGVALTDHDHRSAGSPPATALSSPALGDHGMAVMATAPAALDLTRLGRRPINHRSARRSMRADAITAMKDPARRCKWPRGPRQIVIESARRCVQTRGGCQLVVDPLVTKAKP
jgi:hypothetical protein